MIARAIALALLLLGPGTAAADGPPAVAAPDGTAPPMAEALPRGGIRLVGGLGWMEARAALEGEGWPSRHFGFGGAIARASFNQNKAIEDLLLDSDETITVDSIAGSVLLGTGGETVRGVLRLGGGVAHLSRDRGSTCFIFRCETVKPIDETVPMGSIAGGVLVTSSWVSLSALLQAERYRGYGGSVFFSVGFGLALPPSE